MCDHASIFSAFQSPECDSTLVCHLRVFIKSLSLKLCIYVSTFSTESIGDDKKWVWGTARMEASECEESQRIVLEELEEIWLHWKLLIGIEFASGDLHSFWLRQDKCKWRRSTCVKPHRQVKRSWWKKKRLRLARVYQPLVAHFSHFLLFCFYQWISEICFVFLLNVLSASSLFSSRFYCFALLCPHEAIHHPTCTRQPSCTAQLNIKKPFSNYLNARKLKRALYVSTFISALINDLKMCLTFQTDAWTWEPYVCVHGRVFVYL